MTEPLDKRVAQHARLSRRLAAQAIRRGRVKVSGVVERRPRQRVAHDAPVTLDGQPLVPAAPLMVWHKPVGVLCTLRDPMGRRTLWAEVPDLLGDGLRPVGRLDADTSGLLLFTSDGQLAQRLLHPKRAVPRTYVAQVEGEPTQALVDQLAQGVQTAAGVFTAEDVRLDGTVVRLTVREGKHRMVRRMLNNAGHPVVALQRVAFGPFELGELASGVAREPTDAEQAWLD